MDIFSLLLNEAKQTAQDKPVHTVLSDVGAGLWWQQHLPGSKGLRQVSDKVIWLAFHSENFAGAFNVAYQFALRHLFAEQIQGEQLACLCVSEQGGNSPKIISTYLAHEQGKYVVSGEKTFVTCADKVDTLLLLLDDRSKGEFDNTKTLRILPIYQVQQIIEQQKSGFSLRVSDSGKFLPEIRKGRLKLQDFEVDISTLLAEDGHQYYSKSFSVLEGLFIRLANVSFLLKWSYYFYWPQILKADLLAQIAVLKQIIDTDPLTPQAQILLDGQARMLEQNLPEIETLVLQTPLAFQAHWQRDKLALFMDAQFRKQRLEKAWLQVE